MTVDGQAAGRAVTRAASGAVAATAVTVLLGWAADAPLLTRVSNGWASMKPNTAASLLIVAAGLVLMTLRRPPRGIVVGLGATVVALTSVTLIEWAADVDLRVDEALWAVHEPVAAPGRMAVLTAVALLLLGVGLLAAAADRPRALGVTGLGGFAIGYVALVGYALDAHALYSFVGYQSMALPTSAAITLAAAGLLATRPDRGLPRLLLAGGAAGRLTRRVVPFLVLGAAAIGAAAVAGAHAGLYRPGFAAALLTLAVAAIGVAIVARAALTIDRAEAAQQASATALRTLTERLQAQVRTLVATAPDAIVTVDEAGRVVAANAHAAVMFGRAVDELVGRPVDELLPERMRARHAKHRTEFAASPRLRPMGAGLDLVAMRADGSEFPVTVSLAPMPGDGAPVVLATIRDLTAVRAAETAAAESAHRFAAAFDDAPVGMLLVDLDGQISQVNAALASMLDTDPAALVGRDLLVLLDPRDVDDDLAQRSDLLAGHVHSYQREARLLDVNGEPVWTLVSTALARDAAGRPAHLVLHVEDARSRKQFEGRLQYLADHDPLTGLFNRRRFEQELTQHLAEHARYSGGGAVLLLDLDNFKYVNDTLGHSAGDALIRAVAATLRRRVRDADILARLGGDEFAVLLPAADVAEASTVAAMLLQAVRADRVRTHGAMQTRTTASIGIALLGDGGVEPSPEALLAAADLAMYAAKEEGRDRAVVYDPAGPHLARAQARFRWLDSIHTALERDLLTLQAQPIVELATGRVTQLELLLRMRDGDALIPPGRFLYIAERHGLAPAIDRWVIRRAIAFAATLTSADAPKIEVNISAESLADDTLARAIGDLLAEHRVAGHRLVFEMTETAAIANIDTARAFVEQLTELGCEFALDDFGAGFGSFYYLKYLPFDYLKIDGEFIRGLTASRTDQLIVTSIVAAARGLGKRTVAEYVGDADTLTMLAQLGVDYVQGYHLGRPVDLSAMVVPTPRGPAPRRTRSRA